MDSQNALRAAALLVCLALAGCASSSEPTTTTAKGTAVAATTTTSALANTTTEAPTPPTLTLTADLVNGTVPLNVTFHVDVAPAQGNLTWRLAFGDGEAANGTQLPADPKHGYLIGGNFSALLTVSLGSGSYNATLNLTVRTAGASYPTVFTFGASKAGCVGDAYGVVPGAPLNCVNFVGGPTSPQFDGFWQALDARYVGKSFTSTLATSNPLPDSDCYFVAEDETTTTGDCTNGGDLAAGTVPVGTAWMFIYPYAGPADGIVVTFA